MDNTKEKAEESILHNTAITLPVQKDTFVYSSKKEDAGIYSPNGENFAQDSTEISDKEKQAEQRMEISWKKFEKEREVAFTDYTYIDTTKENMKTVDTVKEAAKANMDAVNSTKVAPNQLYEKEHMDLLRNFMVEEREAYRQQMCNERMIREFLIKAQEEKDKLI